MTVGHECDLCGGTAFELLAERDRLNQPLDTVVCTECGLVSHSQIPTRDELLRYYESKYRRDYHGEYAPAPFRVVREWKRGKLLLDDLRPHIPSHAKVFEVGCGIGCTVMQFALAGYAASGIEPGEGRSPKAPSQVQALDELSDQLQCLLAAEGFTGEPVGGCKVKDNAHPDDVARIVAGVVTELKKRGLA